MLGLANKLSKMNENKKKCSLTWENLQNDWRTSPPFCIPLFHDDPALQQVHIARKLIEADLS